MHEGLEDEGGIGNVLPSKAIFNSIKTKLKNSFRKKSKIDS
jgi:hypothetical protein